jgi:hypothetical protein
MILFKYSCLIGAGEGIRTLDHKLGKVGAFASRRPRHIDAVKAALQLPSDRFHRASTAKFRSLAWPKNALETQMVSRAFVGCGAGFEPAAFRL